MTNPSHIEAVHSLGESQVDRRTALGILGLGLSKLVGLGVSGVSPHSVGLTGENFAHNHPFRAVGGILDGKTLLLPSGTSLTLGKFGNPLIAQGIFHGAPLSELQSERIDHSSIVQSLIRPKDPATLPEPAKILERVTTGRVWCALVDDGKTITRYDVSQFATNPPRLEVRSDGALQITHRGQRVVSFNDGVFLRELHQVDSNRQDTGAFVGYFSQGVPPDQSNPIEVTELDTPVIPTAAAMRRVVDGLKLDTDAPDALSQLAPHETFIVSGDNVWRYHFSPRPGSEVVVFGAECKAHGYRNPDTFSAEWGNMGPRLFYSLETDDTSTLLHPEPDLSKTLELSTRGPSGENLFATGLVILGTNSAGQTTIERTSLSKLGGAAKVSIKGDMLTVARQDGQINTYQIVELRTKPGFATNTVDIHAIDLTNIRGDVGASQLTSLGSFSRPVARRAARELLGV